VNVEIWRGRLDDMLAEPAAAAERAIADELADPLARQRFLAGRAGVRTVLRRVTGRNDAEIGYERSGRPYLPGGPSFSVAHAGTLLLVAVATDDVGIDVEQLRPVRGAHRLGQRMFGQPLSGRAFLSAWVAHEATVKARGGRLLDSFGAAAHVPGNHRILRLHPAPGYLGALAVTTETVRVRYTDLTAPTR
jgi:4'-phosphopantetheinyl transferase